jgi:hypothetical protein
MVVGMESFIQKFRDYSDCYTIIGGAACDILMTEADTDFRATKDIDMILIMEAGQQDVGKEFWEYILEGSVYAFAKDAEGHIYKKYLCNAKDF